MFDSALRLTRTRPVPSFIAGSLLPFDLHEPRPCLAHWGTEVRRTYSLCKKPHRQ